MDPGLRRAIERHLRIASGTWRALGSSAWASTWSVQATRERYFVKLARHPTLLACEADGLSALAATATIRVPEVAGSGVEGDDAWLALEWLDLRPGPPARDLGIALARLHRAPVPGDAAAARFGWTHDNWIGATPQANGWCDDWCAFFRERRLAPQLALAAMNGFGSLVEDGARLLDALPALLAGHAPRPSLLHGDLWAGNAAVLASGEPVVFDPAVYVGDREADLAMTELFGGFGEDFRRGYEETAPVDEGYALRRELYNLYHLLNHVNLFGAAYAARTRRTLSRLLDAIGH